MIDFKIGNIKERIRSPIYIAYTVFAMVWIVVFIVACTSLHFEMFNQKDPRPYAYIAIVAHLVSLVPHGIPVALAFMLQCVNVCLGFNWFFGFTNYTIFQAFNNGSWLKEQPLLAAIFLHIWITIIAIVVTAFGFVIYNQFVHRKDEPSELPLQELAADSVSRRKRSLDRWF